MELLVSVINEDEALEVINSGCHCIIDIKNPKEGSLGANFPSVIKQIMEIIPRNIQVSAAIGDMPNLPGTASLAALGTATHNVNYVKVGLKGLKTKKDAIYLMENVVKAVKNFNPSIKVVAAGYADYARIGSLNPFDIPEIAHLSGSDIVMIDIAIKDGKRLFDFFDIKDLEEFVRKSHKMGLTVALAGSLGKDDVESIFKIGADVFGVRGYICNGDRNSRLNKNKVEELFKEFQRVQKISLLDKA